MMTIVWISAVLFWLCALLGLAIFADNRRIDNQLRKAGNMRRTG